MEFSIGRLTIFALSSAIEQDLREIITTNLSHIDNIEVLFGHDQFLRAIDRQKKDKQSLHSNRSLQELVYYLDFEDHIHLLNRNKGYLRTELAQYISSVTSTITSLTPIRNRVYHTRPLNIDDLSTMQEACDSLITSRADYWGSLCLTLKKLQHDPSFVLGLTLPSYIIKEDKVFNNLPLPDFDETGYIGREKTLEQVKDYCLGPYPVITIVGEGGLGKTALALKIAYELLDMDNLPFDAIIWSSSKTTQLTANEIKTIDGAINTSLGLFKLVGNELSGNADNTGIDEILEYMRNFKIFLILDNMETVLDERIIQFLTKLPNGSKVMITSRIGLGAFEIPVKLAPFTNEESVRFLRTLCKYRNIQSIQSLSSSILEKYCLKMKNNPGYIKWFVSAIQAGRRPEEILANPELFLEFCMSNVYSYISDTSKSIMRSMLCINNEMSQAELVFINKLDIISVQQVIQELIKTSMVKMHSKSISYSFETKYELTEMARMYLQKKYPMKSEEYKKYKDQLNKLIAEKEKYTQDEGIGRYSAFNIEVRSTSDYIVATKLRSALERSKIKDFSKAEELIDQAKALAPEYYEVRRIEAWIQTNQGNMSLADECYQAALDLNTENSALHYWYGMFLMNHINDTATASHQFEAALRIDPNAMEVLFQLSRTYLYQQRFSEAKELLEPLIRQHDMSIIFKRKLWDVYLQVFYREADSNIDDLEVKKIIELLGSFKQAFDMCPEYLYDDSILRILGKVDITIHKMKKKMIDDKGSSLWKEIEDFTRWKENIMYGSCFDENDSNEIDGYTSGTIFKKWPDRTYAFILTEDGVSLYFQQESLHSRNDWHLLRIGRKVQFRIQDDSGRMSAIDVRIK